MLDRHAVQELRRAGVTARAIAKQYGISVRTVRRLGREAAVVGAVALANAGDEEGHRGGGHPDHCGCVSRIGVTRLTDA